MVKTVKEGTERSTQIIRLEAVRIETSKIDVLNMTPHSPRRIYSNKSD